MSTGPLRRAIGLLGLLALVPVLLQLATGVITPEDAAIRGLTIAVTVVVLGRAAQYVLVRLLRRVERRRTDPTDPDDGAPVTEVEDPATSR
jgi:hypothetical protein